MYNDTNKQHFKFDPNFAVVLEYMPENDQFQLDTHYLSWAFTRETLKAQLRHALISWEADSEQPDAGNSYIDLIEKTQAVRLYLPCEKQEIERCLEWVKNFDPEGVSDIVPGNVVPFPVR